MTSPASWFSLVGERLRRRLGHGSVARALVWFFVVATALGSMGLVADGALEHALFLGLTVLFLAWEVLSERLGQWGVLVGVTLLCTGVGMNWHLPLSLGLVAVLLAVPFRRAAVLVVVALGAIVWFWAQQSLPGGLVVRGLFALLQNVLFLYLLERVWRSGKALEETREELARTEVDAERTRLAGELNEVIGSTLAQVALHTAEAQNRTEVTDPEFHRHLSEVGDLVNHGLQQLRLLSFEPVIGDLDSEVQMADSLCRRLGVDLTASVEDVDDEVSEIFALMLRESVTNMFKHATPTRCTVAVRAEDGEAMFGFTNDGVPAEALDTGEGSGHRRWRETVTALGGTLVTTRLEGGRYQVLARVPVTVDPLASPIMERAAHG